MGFLVRMAITAVGLWIASRMVPGIQIAEGPTLLVAAVLYGLVNAIVRPVVVFLTFPITILTLGLFLLFVNAAMFGLVAFFLDGFRVTDIGAALVGSLIVGFTGWIGSWFVNDRGRIVILSSED